MENKISEVITSLMVTDYKSKVDAIKAGFPFMVLLDNEQRKRMRAMAGKLIGYVDAVYTGLKTHVDDLPSNYDFTEFKKDMEMLPIWQELISYLITNLVEPMESTDLQLRHELAEEADYGYLVLKLAGKGGNSAVIKTLGKIAELTRGMGTRPNVVEIDAPAGSIASVNNTIPGSKFVNTGDTVLQLDADPELASSVKVAAMRVNPGNSEILPPGYTKISVTNISKDKAGKFLVKVSGK
jgi:hypothetical protein